MWVEMREGGGTQAEASCAREVHKKRDKSLRAMRKRKSGGQQFVPVVHTFSYVSPSFVICYPMFWLAKFINNILIVIISQN